MFAIQGLELDTKEILGDVHTAPARHLGDCTFGGVDTMRWKST